MKGFARIIELPEHDVLLLKTNDERTEAPQLKIVFAFEDGLRIEVIGGFSEEQRQHRDDRFNSITAEEIQQLIDRQRTALYSESPRASDLMDSADTILLYRVHGNSTTASAPIPALEEEYDPADDDELQLCPICGGWGGESYGSDSGTCEECDGTGYVAADWGEDDEEDDFEDDEDE